MMKMSKAGWVFPYHFTGIPQSCQKVLESTGQEGRAGVKRSGFILWPHYWDLTLEEGRGETVHSSDSGTSEAVKANTPPSSMLQLLVPPSTVARLTCTLHAAGREGASQAPQSSVGVVDVRKLEEWGTWLSLFAEHSQGCPAQALVLGHLMPGARV